MAAKTPPEELIQPTPENTPVPGGGSWCWHASGKWVPNPPYAPPVTTPIDATQPEQGA